MWYYFQEACEKLLSRLDPVIQANPDKTWEEWVSVIYTTAHSQLQTVHRVYGSDVCLCLF